MVSSFAFAGLMNSGCAVMTAGVKKGDERNFSRSLNDVNAARAIRARMHRTEGFKLAGVDVEVAEGIIVLSGNVPRTEDRIEAERIAWSASRIVKVGNEILIKGKQGKIRNMKDGVINKTIRAKLTANSAIKGRNYNIEVNDGVVYLLGVARTPNELATATHVASTTRGVNEVISYVKLTGDYSANFATGPGYNGRPSTSALNKPLLTQPMSPISPQAPSYVAPHSSVLDDDAIESGEPYYLDPQTGERVEIPEGVTPIPYIPDAGPGSLGAGGAPLPLGAGTSLPSDQYLGKYRSGTPGEAVSVIESAPYMLDPATGKMIPVRFTNGRWTPLLIK